MSCVHSATCSIRGMASTALRLCERNPLRVRAEPLRKRLQPRVQCARHLHAARGAEVGIEVALELEHVAEILGAREAEAAVEKAQKLYGENILIEGGITMINELLEHKILDGIELSVTPASGGDDRIDWKGLLAQFEHCKSLEVDGTTFFSAHN